MADDVTRGGRLLAAHIAHAYAGHSDVRAVMLGGSVARGWADEYSDLEIGVFWQQAPPDDARRAAIAQVGGAPSSSFRSFTRDEDGPAGEHFSIEEVEIGGRRFRGTSDIDVKHFTVSGMEWCLAEVLERFDTFPHKQRLLAALVHSEPLHGAELLDRWQRRAAAYPDELARRVVREYLAAGLRFGARAYATRGDALGLNQHLCWRAQAILGILAGLNRVYHPGSQYLGVQKMLPPIKWTAQFAAELRLAPRDLAGRLAATFRDEPQEGWRRMAELMGETLALLEAHMPDLDQVRPEDAEPRVTLAWARSRLAGAEPFTLLQTIGAAYGGLERAGDASTTKSAL